MRAEIGQRIQAVTANRRGPAEDEMATQAVPGGDLFASSRIQAVLARHAAILRYAVIGASGYIVYLGLLVVAYDLAWLSFLPARDQAVDLLVFTHGDAALLSATLIATQASICTVFIGHTLWTFAGPDLRPTPLWLRFVQFEARALVSTLGVLTVTVNVAVLLGVHHYLAIPTGVIATFTWNWLWDSRVIWRRKGRVL